jgi:hypothetical protein
MPFPTVQRVFIVEHYFRMQSYDADKQAYQLNFPDAAVPFFDLLLNSATLRRVYTNMLKRVDLCLQQGGGHLQYML